MHPILTDLASVYVFTFLNPGVGTSYLDETVLFVGIKITDVGKLVFGALQPTLHFTEADDEALHLSFLSHLFSLKCK